MDNMVTSSSSAQPGLTLAAFREAMLVARLAAQQDRNAFLRALGYEVDETRPWTQAVMSRMTWERLCVYDGVPLDTAPPPWLHLTRYLREDTVYVFDDTALQTAEGFVKERPYG